MSEPPRESVRVLVLARLPFRLDDLGSQSDGSFTAQLIRRAETLDEALDKFQPDVLLIDTEFPDGKGLDAIARALVHAPDLHVRALVPD